MHGPPKELITDGESGLVVGHAALEYIARHGTQLHPRGQDQHARYAERRGALLRDTMHRIADQCQAEGLAGITIENILAEAVFCGNALLTVNGSSPYNGVYGRVPRI